ncbi:MAG: hypothetical protein KDH84_20630, partial [Calditrichaeota bacterium]|nr:hypothetical protein [Calditrichota bacterium]
ERQRANITGAAAIFIIHWPPGQLNLYLGLIFFAHTEDGVMRKILAWGMGHGAWCITVQVSELTLAHYGAMPHAPCAMPHAPCNLNQLTYST